VTKIPERKISPKADSQTTKSVLTHTLRKTRASLSTNGQAVTPSDAGPDESARRC